MSVKLQPELPYRADIDGLRAVAVLAVVLFHADARVAPGGFVGVDVFFVISGYLITSVLLRHTSGTLGSTLANFYVRRVRRIVPALLLVILFTLLISHILFLPSDLAALLSDVIAATLFFSNLSAHTDVGYFERSYEVRPLLHTWSLAIEEQFYFVYPVLLLTLLRFGRERASAIVATLTAISLIWSVHLVTTTPQEAFYATSGRAWELGVGAMIAISPWRFPFPHAAKQCCSAAGFAVIGAIIFLYSEEQHFPGLAAVPPVLATALLIATGPATLVATWLNIRPAVAIGKMSYSIYLWHWPALILVEYALGQSLSSTVRVTTLAASMIAAFLSWKYVEHPFHKRDGFSRHVILLSTGIAAAVILGTAIVGKLTNGWPQRFSQADLEIAAAVRDSNPRRGQCHRTESFDPPLAHSCHYGSGPHRIAVWGDSHGVELSAALGEMIDSRQESVVQLTYTSCPPTTSTSAAAGCMTFNSNALEYLTRSRHIRFVVLVAKYDDPAVRDNRLILEGVARSAQRLIETGKTVILIYPVPLQPGIVPRALAVREHFGFVLSNYGTGTPEFLRRNAGTFAYLDSMQATNLIRVKPHTVLCNPNRCAAIHSGTVLYFDDNHLSLSGARILASEIERRLTKQEPSTPGQ